MAIPLWAAVAGAGALKGVLDARANKKKQKQLDAFRRAAITYSPWTGMGDPGPMSAGNTSMFGGALQGGIQGGMLAALAGNAGLLGKGGATQSLFGGGSAATAPGITTGPTLEQAGLTEADLASRVASQKAAAAAAPVAQQAAASAGAIGNQAPVGQQTFSAWGGVPQEPEMFSRHSSLLHKAVARSPYRLMVAGN